MPQPPGAASGVGTRRSIGERAEGALIGEDDGELAVLGMLDVEPDALVPLGGGARRAQQQLAAHAQVADDGLVGRRTPRRAASGSQRNLPRRAAAPTIASGECRLEVRAVRRRAASARARRARVTPSDRRAGDRGREAGADDLDLGKLRHVR